MREICFFRNTVFLSTLFLLLAISFSFAQEAYKELERINNLFSSFGGIVATVSQIVVAAAFLFFFWNLAAFIIKGKGENLEEKKRIGFGIIALFVLVSIWGFISLLNSIFFGDLQFDSPGGIRAPSGGRVQQTSGSGARQGAGPQDILAEKRQQAEEKKQNDTFEGDGRR